MSGGVQAGNIISQPPPSYPPLARQARISGLVLLEANISVDGTIENVRVITGHPLLAPAAVRGREQVAL